MNEQLQKIREALQLAPQTLNGKKIAAGFDGFIDSIVKIVNHKAADGTVSYFETIKGFGDYISGKSGSGFSLESDERLQKLGGNMPIMANAMAQWGIMVDCVGALGVPAIQPAFSKMHANCRLHSYTNPGFTTAMEFTDGKIMLAQMTDLNHADWTTIKTVIGLPTLRTIFCKADLVCLVNWSEPDQSNAMWQGLLEDIFAYDATDKSKRQFFADLSDCSKRSDAALLKALELLKEFGKYGKVMLSLNRNEAGILYRLFTGLDPAELHEIGDHLFKELKISTLIIHTSKISIAWDAAGTYTDQPSFIQQPLVSTGAGDNFNAGFCVGQLLGLDAEQSLILANSTSNCYIKSGLSPGPGVLENYFYGIISSSL